MNLLISRALRAVSELVIHQYLLRISAVFQFFSQVMKFMPSLCFRVSLFSKVIERQVAWNWLKQCVRHFYCSCEPSVKETFLSYHIWGSWLDFIFFRLRLLCILNLVYRTVLFLWSYHLCYTRAYINVLNSIFYILYLLRNSFCLYFIMSECKGFLGSLSILVW